MVPLVTDLCLPIQHLEGQPVASVNADRLPLARGAQTLSESPWLEELPSVTEHLGLGDQVSSPWQIDLERFCRKIVDAIVGDPILYQMVDDSPELAQLLVDRAKVAEGPESDPTSMDDFGRCLEAFGVMQHDAATRAWVRDYGIRIYLVLAPMLRDFTRRQDFDQIVRSFAEAVITPENMESAVDGLLPHIDRAFTPDHLPYIREVMTAVLDDVVHPDWGVWLEELIEWAVDVLGTPEELPTLRSISRWLLSRVLAPERLTSVIDRLTRAFVEWSQDWSEWLAAEDLDIEQAAFWLSITPSTMHKHIQTRVGTDAAVPVRLVKDQGGRGRGKYYVLRRDLFVWARAHWRSPKKRILFPG